MTAPLTPEQNAIVMHDHGPALVFAVAGAGKTTTMTYRIERLVREGVFPAKAVLATSFSSATVADIRQALNTWPYCRDVRVLTLHALGLRILKRAQQKGYMQTLTLAEETHSLYFAALSQAKAHHPDLRFDLEGTDQADFLDWVSACKGNLAYADLGATQLPHGAQHIVSQAEAPAELPWYLPLYQAFEAQRLSRQVLTFDDMLLGAWEVLWRHQDILAEVQRFYQTVMVDEFQDVNLAQAELLDLITQPKPNAPRNYMAIGDDDQTIYEWRGASPRFILEFETRYQAKTYVISENFRSKLQHLMLANAVITHNKMRYPKHLNLTQGVDGVLTCEHHPDSEAQALAILNCITETLRAGHALSDIAILVRIYAQTGFIERQLLEQALPYNILGSVPFFLRPEVRALWDYLLLGHYEANQQRGALPAAARQDLPRALSSVWNRPTRYLPHSLRDQVVQFALHQHIPLSTACTHLAATLPTKQQDALTDLADVLTWLSRSLDQDAADTLKALEQQLQYLNHLRQNSGFKETGEAKALSTAALMSQARGKGSVQSYLHYLEHLHTTYEAMDNKPQRITLTTMFRAKGLQWKTVIIPDNNAPYYPFGESSRTEEERRLYYVALTRPRQNLHLYAVQDIPTTPFLYQANYATLCEHMNRLQACLLRDRWSVAELTFLAHAIPEHHLGRYLGRWLHEDHRRALIYHIWRLGHKAETQGVLAQLYPTPAHRHLWQTLFADHDVATYPGPLLCDFGDLKAYLKPAPPPPKHPPTPSPPPSLTPTELHEGMQVMHSTFGVGEIVLLEQGAAHVQFEAAGYRKLAIKYARLQGVDKAIT